MVPRQVEHYAKRRSAAVQIPWRFLLVYGPWYRNCRYPRLHLLFILKQYIAFPPWLQPLFPEISANILFSSEIHSILYGFIIMAIPCFLAAVLMRWLFSINSSITVANAVFFPGFFLPYFSWKKGLKNLSLSDRIYKQSRGPLVKRLRHRPLKAVTGVRFPYGLPKNSQTKWFANFFNFHWRVSLPPHSLFIILHSISVSRILFYRFITIGEMIWRLVSWLFPS